MPAFGKSSGSLKLTVKGQWMRKGSSKPLIVLFDTKSITEDAAPTYGLPAAEKSGKTDELKARDYPEPGLE